jgi:hypothetical protein
MSEKVKVEIEMSDLMLWKIRDVVARTGFYESVESFCHEAIDHALLEYDNEIIPKLLRNGDIKLKA